MILEVAEQSAGLDRSAGQGTGFRKAVDHTRWATMDGAYQDGDDDMCVLVGLASGSQVAPSSEGLV